MNNTMVRALAVTAFAVALGFGVISRRTAPGPTKISAVWSIAYAEGRRDGLAQA